MKLHTWWYCSVTMKYVANEIQDISIIVSVGVGRIYNGNDQLVCSGKKINIAHYQSVTIIRNNLK